MLWAGDLIPKKQKKSRSSDGRNNRGAAKNAAMEKEVEIGGEGGVRFNHGDLEGAEGALCGRLGARAGVGAGAPGSAFPRGSVGTRGEIQDLPPFLLHGFFNERIFQ